MVMNQEGLCDLHTHTQASDGLHKPAENVHFAKQKGLAAIAITDHDTIAGIEEALRVGEEDGVIVVPGIEISTRVDDQDIHVLGYYIDFHDQVFLRRLEELRSTRERRNELIISKLQQLGVSITLDEVINHLGRPLRADESIGRPHIADLLVHKGYVSNMREAFDRYLAEGAAAYVSLPRITPAEAMNWIREADGTPVLAHPGLYKNDDLVRAIIEEGRPAGIEVYHSDHSEADEERYMLMAEHYELIMTGGSDFHGARQGVIFHGDIGNRTVSAEVLSLLSSRRGI
ncbi:PHP domain-containing protein [Paenibacillus sediminis]|uniref:Metal-dependent phosphoesterase TrpH n=1 Tax=Paenibacillus sediminis TaxID=664909 RepID=A0ABS4H0B3_9BACL|nr:putative metal-dependent phosphoesterase TrpH [Paenibacillus sediminis]